MSLENWLQSGYLLEHTPTVAEVQKRLALVSRELSDAGATGPVLPQPGRPDRRQLRPRSARKAVTTSALTPA